MAYSLITGIFEANSGSNSYKKSGKIGVELNSWMNSGTLLASARLAAKRV